MQTCTFFGHRECPIEIKAALTKAITELIAEGVNRFLVGDSGEFDRMVFQTLIELKKTYSDICIKRIIAYFPKEEMQSDYAKYSLLPEGIENVMPRFAIEYRNNYMLSRADVVVAYTVCDAGGASKFVNKAKRRGIAVINLGSRE
ncbi:MAG: hypothetical protein J6Q72_01285 [Clostridia bacterium]|nr:hypothetical protein [Clostridia bacterium]MBO5913957.1 hypothetical protein [Clostridia bacterium]